MSTAAEIERLRQEADPVREHLRQEAIAARDRVRAIEADPVRGFPSAEDYAAVAETAARYRRAAGLEAAHVAAQQARDAAEQSALRRGSNQADRSRPRA